MSNVGKFTMGRKHEPYYYTKGELREARENLHHWQYNNTNSFTCMLYTLFQKADPPNRARLTKGFPANAAAFKEWFVAPNQEDLFEKWGLETPRAKEAKKFMNELEGL